MLSQIKITKTKTKTLHLSLQFPCCRGKITRAVIFTMARKNQFYLLVAATKNLTALAFHLDFKFAAVFMFSSDTALVVDYELCLTFWTTELQALRHFLAQLLICGLLKSFLGICVAVNKLIYLTNWNILWLGGAVDWANNLSTQLNASLAG